MYVLNFIVIGLLGECKLVCKMSFKFMGFDRLVVRVLV